MDKAEKKRLAQEQRERQEKEFLASLPMPQAMFHRLFDYLNKQSEEKDCLHDFTLTTEFLQSNALPENAVLEWLGEHGAGCDCEVIFNVEEYFE